MYEVLKELFRTGKIRAVGVSNFHKKAYSDFIQNCGIIPAIDQVESHVYFPQLNLQSILQKKRNQDAILGIFY